MDAALDAATARMKMFCLQKQRVSISVNNSIAIVSATGWFKPSRLFTCSTLLDTFNNVRDCTGIDTTQHRPTSSWP